MRAAQQWFGALVEFSDLARHSNKPLNRFLNVVATGRGVSPPKLLCIAGKAKKGLNRDLLAVDITSAGLDAQQLAITSLDRAQDVATVYVGVVVARLDGRGWIRFQASDTYPSVHEFLDSSLMTSHLHDRLRMSMLMRKGISKGISMADDKTSDHSTLTSLPGKNQAAAEMGRRGGKKGGATRAARMSPEERAASARLAAQRRWAKPPAALTTATTASEPVALEAEVMPPSPFAKHRGVMTLGDVPIDVYVLDTGDRVISMRGAVKAMTGKDAGNLVEYLSVSGLKGFIDKGLVLGETKDFFIPGTQFRGVGITAEQFEAILTGYVQALGAGKLSTARQREIATACAILSTSFLRVGIIALIDEATGYQFERAQDALNVKIQAYIAEELRPWEPTFPDELWEQFGRLTNWKGPLHSRPKWWGHLVNELIYQALDPDVAEYLKKNKPKPFHGQNYHQWLSEDVGLKALIPHIYKIIGMAEKCQDMRELRDSVAAKYGRKLVQLTLSLPKNSNA